MSLYRSVVLAALLLFGFIATAVQSTSFYNEHTNEIDPHADEDGSSADTEEMMGLFGPLFSPARSMPLSEEEARDAGDALFLTPYIEQGKINEARKLSRVTLPDDPRNTISFSGFLTVDPKYESNMFFWFFPAKEAFETAPIIIWLQGGPGGSGMFGLFVENGPFNVDADMKLVYRDYSWTDKHNMIFFDNPVGTGFSFTRDDAGYSTNEVEVGENLYRATVQFLQLFPELQQNELFVSGESYGAESTSGWTSC